MISKYIFILIAVLLVVVFAILALSFFMQTLEPDLADMKPAADLLSNLQ